MVKVLQVDVFETGGLVPLMEEPTAVATASGEGDDKGMLVAATVDGVIVAYDANSTPVHCFQSRGLVHSLDYSEVHDVLVSVETLPKEDVTEVEYVFPRNDSGYNEWRVRSGPSPHSPTVGMIPLGGHVVVTHIEEPWMRVSLEESGITGWTRATMNGIRYLHEATNQPSRIAARVYANWRKGSLNAPAGLQLVHQVDKIDGSNTEDMTAVSTAIISDPQEGAVSLVKLQHDDNSVECVAICPVTGCVAVGSDASIIIHTIHFIEDKVPVIARKYSLVPKCQVDMLSLCMDHCAYASEQEVYIIQARMNKTDKSISSEKGDATGRLDASSGISRTKCVTLMFDKENKPSPATSMLGLQVPFVPTGHASTKKNDDTERLGPIRVADHGLRVAPRCGVEISECRQFLFRKFPDDTHLHTLSLIPTYPGVSESAQLNAHGVCCFLSHEACGYMYDVSEETRLLSDYIYQRPSNHAAISQFLLYVSSAGSLGGIDVYTIRNALASRMDVLSPPDISLLYSKRLFSPEGISVWGPDVAILVKQSESKESDKESLRRGIRNGERCFNVYMFRTQPIDVLCDELLEIGESYKQSNWPYYHQILLEGHYLLRAKVAVLLKSLYLRKNDVELKAKYRSYLKLLKQSHSLLGDHERAQRKPPWSRIAAHYAASDLMLSEILDRLVPASFRDNLGKRLALSDNDLEPGKASLTVFQEILFSKEHEIRIDDTPKIANIVLNVFWLISFEDLPQVIISSLLTKYTPEFAILLLKALPKSLNELWNSKSTNTNAAGTITSSDSNEGAAAHGLALGLLYLRTGNQDAAMKHLSNNAKYIKEVCIARPQLLFIKELSESFLPMKLVSSEEFQPSRLCNFLRESFPQVLKEILICLGSMSLRSGKKASVATCIRAMVPKDDDINSANRMLAIEMLSTLLPTVSVESTGKTTCVTYLMYFLLLQLIEEWKQGTTQGEDINVKEVSSWDRPEWLNHIPPFNDNPPRISKLAAATLRRLQGVIFQNVSSENAEAIYNIVIKSKETNFPGKLSLELLCLPAMGRVDEGQRMLLRVYPAALLGYSQSFLPKDDIERWKSLQWSLLALVQSRISDIDLPSVSLEEDGDTGEVMSSAEITRNKPMLNNSISDDVYLETYKSMLNHVATITDPTTFLSMLPLNGKVAFFLPYIEKSYRNQCAEKLSQRVGEIAVAL
eukprot:m.49128 g.49128  ORF g.49128 m.49128 type:complete len:1191 (+) comp10599_c0_seq1:214-3786(+)